MEINRSNGINNYYLSPLVENVNDNQFCLDLIKDGETISFIFDEAQREEIMNQLKSFKERKRSSIFRDVIQKHIEYQTFIIDHIKICSRCNTEFVLENMKHKVCNQCKKERNTYQRRYRNNTKGKK